MCYSISFEDCFNILRYPAGESHVYSHYLPRDGSTIIASHVRSFEDLGNILTANRILKRRRYNCKWFIPYFPFARHDRRLNKFDGFELEVALDLIKELDFTILDPHSDVTGILPHIPQYEVVRMWAELGLFDVKYPIVVIPDQGATKKADTWKGQILGKGKILQARKVRNTSTGDLSGFYVEDLEKIKKRSHVIIIDDICDGGGTFLGLAGYIRKETGIQVPMTLAVTHGLFTKGIEILKKNFDHIFTTGHHPEVKSLAHSYIFDKGTVI